MTRGWRFLGRSVAAALALLPAYAVVRLRRRPRGLVAAPEKGRRHRRPGPHVHGRAPSGRSAERRLRRDARGSSGRDACGRLVRGRSHQLSLGTARRRERPLRAPYVSAPMSTHFLGDRPQDLGFEQIVGGSPRRRHHVRFWRAASAPGEPALWIGAATYDESIGISHYTGEVMHHIDPADRRRAREALRGPRARGPDRLRRAAGGLSSGGLRRQRRRRRLRDRRRAAARPR